MEFNEFIQGLAEEFGIQALEIVDEAAAFEADGMPLFLMRVVKEGESDYLVVAADLGEPPPQRLEKLYEALLDAGHNFSVAGGGVFSRNPGDGHIWLQMRETLAAIDVGDAISKVKAFGDAAVNWRDIIKEYREGTSIEQDGALGGRGLPGFEMV